MSSKVIRSLRRGAPASAGLAAVLVLGAAAPVHADTPSPAPAASSPTAAPTSSPPGSQGDRRRWAAKLEKRADRLCDRLPKVEARLDRIVTRINAGADTRGSVAWLHAKADQVRDRQPELAELLDGRAEIRQARLPVLKLRRQQLPKVKAWCETHERPAGK